MSTTRENNMSQPPPYNPGPNPELPVPPENYLYSNRTPPVPPSQPVIQRTWFILLMLIAFLPVGLVFLWINPTWSRKAKGWTSVAAILLLGGVSNSNNKQELYKKHFETAHADSLRLQKARHDQAARQTVPGVAGASTAQPRANKLAASVPLLSPMSHSSTKGVDSSARESQSAEASRMRLTPGEVVLITKGQLGKPAVAGKAVNTSTKALRYLEARAEFLDDAGKVIASGTHSSSDPLAAGDVWVFEVMRPPAASAARKWIITVTGIAR
jgi:hypothetical protein